MHPFLLNQQREAEEINRGGAEVKFEEEDGDGMATIEFCLHLTHKLKQETLSFMCTIRFSLFYLLGIIYTLMSTVGSQDDKLRTLRRTLQDAVFSC